MRPYPVYLTNLQNVLIIVIGGGLVAARKVNGLLEAGAKVTVISPQLSSEMLDLVNCHAEKILVLQRPYQTGDLKDAFLVISATNNAEVNQMVREEAIHRNCLVNLSDDPQNSNFINPAVVQQGSIMIAVSTGAASPFLAHFLRKRLEDWLEPAFGHLADLLAQLRIQLSVDKVHKTRALEKINARLKKILESEGVEKAIQYIAEQINDHQT